MFEFSPEEKIRKSKIDLHKSHPFFAYILWNMRVFKRDNLPIPTMGVNDKGDLLYNEEFVNELSLKDTRTILVHEVMHIVVETILRRKNRHPLVWNIASDLVINWYIRNSGIEMGDFLSKSGCVPDKGGNFNLEKLLGAQQNIKIKKKTNPIINVSNKLTEDVYEDIMSFIDTLSEGEGESENKNGGSGEENREGNRNGRDGKDGRSGGGGKDGSNYTGQIDNHIESGISKEEKTKQTRKWRNIITEALTSAKMRGSDTAELERLVGEILEPEINWKDYLYQYISKLVPYNYTYSKYGKQSYITKCVFPGMLKENMNLLVATDVSGSISNEEYVKFISELIGIVNAFSQIKMRCLWWSTYVDPEDDIEFKTGEEQKLLTHKVNNSGGTILSCVHKYMTQNHSQYNPDCVIYLTDGEVEHNPVIYGKNAIFVISKNGRKNILQNTGHKIIKLNQ